MLRSATRICLPVALSVVLAPAVVVADVIIVSPGVRTVLADGESLQAGQQVESQVVLGAYSPVATFTEDRGVSSGTATASLTSIVSEDGTTVALALGVFHQAGGYPSEARAAGGSTLGEPGGVVRFQVTEPTYVRVTGTFSYASGEAQRRGTVVVGLSAAPYTTNLVFAGWGNVTLNNWAPGVPLDQTVTVVPGGTYDFRWSGQIS